MFYRQRLSGRVRHRRAMPAVAFGHVIRQQHADVHSPGTTCLATAKVQPISWDDAKQIITLYEPMPRFSSGLAYGLLIDGVIAGAVVFGPDPAANLWRRFDGQIIALLRGACAPWAPRNAGSKLLRGRCGCCRHTTRSSPRSLMPRSASAA
jgi:hypothetical protein